MKRTLAAVFYFTTLILCSIGAFSQTHTAKQLYDEQRQNPTAFESKYRNKQITVSGKIRSISPVSYYWEDSENFHRVFLTASGYENYITCQIPYKDSAILKTLKAGETITVTGVVAPAMTDGLFLNECSFSAAKLIVVKKAAPANPPMGKYNVYQNDAAGFSFQYTFFLNPKSYVLNGKPGNYTYNETSKVIRFTSGSLKGFTGIYRPYSNNEKDPPSIVINFSGEVPDLTSTSNGYQYGYFQGK